VYSIRTTGGGTHAAMPDKVANNSPDNRTPNATARSRISLTCKGNDGKAKDGWNEKQIFHGWLLLSRQLFRWALVQLRRELNRNVIETTIERSAVTRKLVWSMIHESENRFREIMRNHTSAIRY
jgi:hypothetical protein